MSDNVIWVDFKNKNKFKNNNKNKFKEFFMKILNKLKNIFYFFSKTHNSNNHNNRKSTSPYHKSIL
ncbi:hypothetical protein SAMN05428976_11614 [Clostridium sp. USBA 49]|uniref:hypothetical protein n=1 Tax=Clostridium sp. USBA 49 TaxID=1881060 RepID=UPI00099AE521|nr:hypothetical protein [Clostridium sp. USBA 49]SKA91111.1 hypothetical protein SAMN05428976_11614 [Clostridium sp. USBA 49]